MTGLGDLQVQDDPFAYYRDRMAGCPVWHEDELDLYVVGGHPEARATLMDVETFSSRPGLKLGKLDEATLAYNEVLKARGWGRAATLQRTDPPVHTRYRKLLNRVFTPARVRDLTPHIEDIARDLIDRFAPAGRCEFVSEFALPMPGILIAEQLGLERSEYQRFRRWADAMLALAQRRMTVEEAVAEAEVEVEAQHFLAAEFERRRQHPSDDLISLLVHAHGDDEEPFTVHELQDLMHQLITGGFETTTGALAKGMLLLVAHPDQAELLRSDPELIKNFVEETLRFDSPVQGLWRTVACPAKVGDVTIPEGASVMVRYGAANRDPRVFDEPDRFDVTRPDAKNHVAFGFGNHYCVGAALARQEMLTAFTMLLDRLHDIELDEPLPAPVHEPSFFLRPMKRLPLRFRADPR
jgi:cytochrome P450